MTRVNLLFQSTHADLTKVYGDLKMLLLSIAKRIIKPIFLRDDEFPSVLRSEDVKKVADALNNPLALLPIAAVDFGFAFKELSEKKQFLLLILIQYKQIVLHF